METTVTRKTTRQGVEWRLSGPRGVVVLVKREVGTRGVLLYAERGSLFGFATLAEAVHFYAEAEVTA